MNRRVGIVLATLVVAGILTTVQGTLSQPTPQAARKVIDLPGKTVQAPFSDAILTGNTLYLAGRIGLDPKTGKAPDKIEDEIKILLDGEKDVLAQAGMTMDDLVYVQISCTDLTLFEKFNPIYKSYFNSIRFTNHISRRSIPRAPLLGQDRFCGADISSCKPSRSNAKRTVSECAGSSKTTS